MSSDSDPLQRSRLAADLRARLDTARSRLTDTARVAAGRVTAALSVSVIRTGLITAAVLVFDWTTPLGVSAGVLYMASVLSAVPIRHPKAIYITAGICTILVLVGWMLSPSRGESELWKVVLNRALSIGIIWAAAAMADSWNQLQHRRDQQLRESRLMQQATAFSSAQVSFGRALHNSLKTICDILGWPAGHVYFRAGGGRHLVSSETWYLPKDGSFELLRKAAQNLRFGHGDGVPGRVWQTGEPLCVRDVAESGDYGWLYDAQRLGVRGAFALPVTVGGQVAAVLEFFSAEEIDVDADFLSLARNVGEQLGRLFERKRAEEALRKSEERLRLAVQGGRMGTWEWQVDAQRIIWSPEVERMHALSPGSFEGTLDAFSRNIHPEDRSRVLRELQQAVDQGHEFRIEYRIMDSDKSVQWLESRGAVHAAGGQARRMVGVCVNVTERKVSEEETRRAKEVAEAANRMRSQFLANVSHELRTPMNAILGTLQLSLDETLPQDVRQWLHMAKGSADSLLKLLDDLLDFSKLEAGRAKLQSEPFLLRKTVNEAVRPLASKAFEKGLEVVLDIPHDVPDAVRGDADRLRQVLGNLLTNAIKFTEQGEVVVRAELEKQLPEEARLRFTVSDTGVGISPNDQRRVFEPFAQADASTTRQHGGVGLGLAICSELVRQMGGQLAVESKMGEGSRFWFSLTLRREEKGTPTMPDGAASDELRDLPVLIVDDNETIRQLLQETVTAWYVRPDAAVDADHALGKLHRAEKEGNPYCLLIVDALMPGVDGFTLADQIAQDFDDPPAVILMLSSADRHLFHERGRDIPCAAYVEKPVDSVLLLEAMMTALDLRPADLPTKPATPPSAASRGLSILLAEDAHANQQVVLAALQRRGHAVKVAENGREAVEMWKADGFDAVLMDVQMPIMDGYQATAAIRALEQDTARCHTPIIAMTAHAMEGDRERCLAAGMDSYVSKPIALAQLVELVETAAPTRDGQPRSTRDSHLTPDEIAGQQRHLWESDGQMNALPIVDYAGAMQRLGGDRQLFAHLIQIFDEDSPPLVEAIRRTAADGDGQALSRAAHSLKGLVANFGAQRAVELAQRLEQEGKSGSLHEACEAVSLLEQELAHLDQALNEFRSA